MISSGDTIVAIATPVGRGGLGVVRLSGPGSHGIAVSLLRREGRALEPRRATFGRVEVTSFSGVATDQVIATFFPGPHSYTGEDVVEISAHGSPVVLALIVAASTKAGARLARPGEFTFRAYLHGRIDLIQAEAVADLVDAVTPAQAQVAFDQLDGRLTESLQALERQVFDLVVPLEASLDFPEEDYHFIGPATLRASLGAIRDRIGQLRREAETGRLIREGAHAVIAGRPNVGKSSTFNALIGVGRAIVTAQPGTTRDLLTERADVGGIPITLVDTAGLRDSREEIEQEGIARARRAANVADVCLVVLDRSQPLGVEDHVILDDLRHQRRLVVANKCDLPGAWSVETLAAEVGSAVYPISARTFEGIDALRAAIAESLGAATDRTDAPAISNVRHLGLLLEADGAVARAMAAVEGGASEEFVLHDLREAMQAFDQIVGLRSPSDVLDSIFARFCIGK